MIIHESDVHERYSSGDLPLKLQDVREPLDLGALGGRVQVLEAKQDELPLYPGDIVQYTWQGGGGYGDPLERASEEVAADVRIGYVSAARALSAYGVIAGEDAEQTANRRDEMRKRRLQDATAPAKHSNGGKIGKRLSRFGSGLVLAMGEAEQLQFECECSHVLCGAHENWKEHAAHHSLEGRELPAGIKLHTTMELVEYLCPSCGRQHALDVKERGSMPLHDLKITRWVEA